MEVYFNTPTQISLLDITSMGDSVKAGDETKIGTYDSGINFCIALLLRADVKINIKTFDENQNILETFDFDTTLSKDDSTGKEKELITVITSTETIVTAFAKKLGLKWELWMALRELWSNMVDEDGNVTVDKPDSDAKTVITLSFDEDNPFHDIWTNKHKYIFDETKFDKVYKLSSSTIAVKSECGTLKIFKQGVLVHESDTPSLFWYSIGYGEIDERRILSNVHSVNTSIKGNVLSSRDEEFLREIIKPDFKYNDKDFLAGGDHSWQSIGETAFKMCHDIAEEHGTVETYDWIMAKVKKDKKCKLPGRKLVKVEDSLWSYSQDVVVETQSEVKDETILDKIKSNYNFNYEVSIVESTLSGGKCIADKYNKCLLIDKSFDAEEDFAEFLVEFVDLTMEGNVVKNLSQMISDLLKK